MLHPVKFSELGGWDNEAIDAALVKLEEFRSNDNQNTRAISWETKFGQTRHRVFMAYLQVDKVMKIKAFWFSHKESSSP